MVDQAQKWKNNFPSYSFFFHGDEAVDRLLKQDWPEFPHLAKIMNTCVKFGGAIKIDIWRVLVLYKYGGFYSDMDRGPGVKLTEDVIQPSDSAFFLSDAWNRPSQWLHAMEPNHPIAYFTMFEILNRVLALQDISSIKPVFLTGPDALKHGYGRALDWTKTTDDIYASGVHVGKFSKLVRKISFEGGEKESDYVAGYTQDLVAWNGVQNITRQERVDKQLNSIHWSKMIKVKAGIPRGPCWDQLYETDQQNFSETA
jgi:mannosyltransferase OCH1-like enzyme